MFWTTRDFADWEDFPIGSFFPLLNSTIAIHEQNRLHDNGILTDSVASPAALDPTMPIQFRCSTCNKLLSIASRKAGQTTECPVCGGKIEIPNELASQWTGNLPPDQATQNSETTQSPHAEEIVQLQNRDAPAIDPIPNLSPKTQTKSLPSAKPTAKSILDIDPDSFFGPPKTQARKPIHPTPQPGVLDDMYDNQGENAVPPQANEAPISNPKEVSNRDPKPSWKMIFFGIFIVVGMMVAIYYAWNLGYPKALWST